ncbi:MAG: formylglycine-generating enzyme family protein [Phycisphaerae bacterium]
MRAIALPVVVILSALLPVGCNPTHPTPSDSDSGQVIQSTWKEDLPEQTTLRLPKGKVIHMVLIRPGRFTMGSPAEELGRDDDEGPRRIVTITHPYYVGSTEVTQQQYAAVMQENPSRYRGANRPVDSVEWLKAAAFCDRVSQRTGQEVRLPTEAEWERACRAGSDQRFCYGDDSDRLKLYATYRGEDGSVTLSRTDPNEPGQGTTPVGSHQPNAWGLHDMHGNLFEWCNDWYRDAYNPTDRVDPQGPPDGPYRVLRGGSFASPDWLCRSAYRHRFSADGRYDHLIGFRVVMVPRKPPNR